MIADPAEHFEARGGCHDAVLTSFRWNDKSGVVELTFDNYRANFSEDGDPQYSAVLEFRGVSDVEADFDSSYTRVMSLDVSRVERGWQASLLLNSGKSLAWTFLNVTEVETPA